MIGGHRGINAAIAWQFDSHLVELARPIGGCIDSQREISACIDNEV